MSSIDYTTIALLESNADSILYTYGVGQSQIQATPPYFLELAKINPSKKFEMIHSDPVFSNSEKCLNLHEWKHLDSDQPVAQFQHRKLANLQVRLIAKTFSLAEEFDPLFKEYIGSKLQKGVNIFLGVHNGCWTDMQCCLGETYNHFYETYRGRIHLYIQAGLRPAFVYKGPYHPILGLFAKAIQNTPLFEPFKKVFSQNRPSKNDVDCVRDAMEKFLGCRKGIPWEQKTIDIFHDLREREQAALTCSDDELTKYIGSPLTNRVLYIPIEKLTPGIWSAEPGQEELLNRYPTYQIFAATACSTLALAWFANAFLTNSP